MSRWGIPYKGVEIVSPDDWNSIVDALNELDGRAPLEIKAGTATFSGDGVTTDFEIAHGMSEEPTIVLLQAYSKDASGDKWVETSETSIIIHFASAPPSGTDNIVIKYLAIRI